jgi:hypothetical protein
LEARNEPSQRDAFLSFCCPSEFMPSARGQRAAPDVVSMGAWPGMQTAQRPEGCILSTPVGSCGDTHVKIAARDFHHRRLSRRLASTGPDGQHSKTTGL